MTAHLPRKLRVTMTDAERRIWLLIRNRQIGGCKFRRQHPIGPYIADFACIERTLIVEIDGGQHADSASDQQRTTWLESQGWHVIRFWNHEVLAETNGVLQRLSELLGQTP